MFEEVKKALFKEAMTTGIITLAICLIIFFFLNKASMGLAATTMDLPTTIPTTALIVAIIQVIVKRGAAKKGAAAPLGDAAGQISYLLLPKNCVSFIIGSTIISFLLFCCVPIGIFATFFAAAEIPNVPYFIIKALLAALTASYVTLHSTVFVLGLPKKVAAENAVSSVAS
jgi:hypothetical protein